MRTIMLVDHRVDEFDAWLEMYDEAADDPNRVLVTHAFDSRDDAEAFAANPELKEKMGKGGVVGSSVRIEYFDEVEMEDV